MYSRRALSLSLALFLVLMVALAACSRREAPRLAPLGMAEISGDRLWLRISQEEPFQSYPAWPAYEGLRPGQSPHGRFHRIYINPILAEALPIASNTAPPGSIIIKENYGPQRQVEGYTIMTKVTGYNPEAGDWFWSMHAADGRSLEAGRPAMCIDCHSSSASDYVLLQRLDWAGAEGP